MTFFPVNTMYMVDSESVCQFGWAATARLTASRMSPSPSGSAQVPACGYAVVSRHDPPKWLVGGTAWPELSPYWVRMLKYGVCETSLR